MAVDFIWVHFLLDLTRRHRVSLFSLLKFFFALKTHFDITFFMLFSIQQISCQFLYREIGSFFFFTYAHSFTFAFSVFFLRNLFSPFFLHLIRYFPIELISNTRNQKIWYSVGLKNFQSTVNWEYFFFDSVLNWSRLAWYSTLSSWSRRIFFNHRAPDQIELICCSQSEQMNSLLCPQSICSSKKNGEEKTGKNEKLIRVIHKKKRTKNRKRIIDLVLD